MQIQREIDLLDQDIQRLKREYERFFSGNLATPPEDFRQAVQRQIRNLRSRPIPHLVHRFRLNTLEARFNTLNELFNRRLRDHEEGAQASGSGVSHPTRRRYDPYDGIVVGETPPPEAMRALYTELFDADQQGGRAEFGKFQSYVLGQMTKIRERTGCSQVTFRLAEEGGKLKLKAKPVRPVQLPAVGESESG